MSRHFIVFIVALLCAGCGSDGDLTASISYDATISTNECSPITITFNAPVREELGFLVWLPTTFYSDSACTSVMSTSPTFTAGEIEKTFYIKGFSSGSLEITFVLYKLAEGVQEIVASLNYSVSIE